MVKNIVLTIVLILLCGVFVFLGFFTKNNFSVIKSLFNKQVLYSQEQLDGIIKENNDKISADYSAMLGDFNLLRNELNEKNILISSLNSEINELLLNSSDSQLLQLELNNKIEELQNINEYVNRLTLQIEILNSQLENYGNLEKISLTIVIENEFETFLVDKNTPVSFSLTIGRMGLYKIIGWSTTGSADDLLSVNDFSFSENTILYAVLEYYTFELDFDGNMLLYQVINGVPTIVDGNYVSLTSYSTDSLVAVGWLDDVGNSYLLKDYEYDEVLLYESLFLNKNISLTPILENIGEPVVVYFEQTYNTLKTELLLEYGQRVDNIQCGYMIGTIHSETGTSKNFSGNLLQLNKENNFNGNLISFDNNTLSVDFDFDISTNSLSVNVKYPSYLENLYNFKTIKIILYINLY